MQETIMSSVIEAQAISIRTIERIEELRDIEALQKDAWGCADLDVVPLTMLVASREVGGVLMGAYDEAKLVGFVYGFPGFEQGHATHHSHMLAVSPAYRNHNLGYKLKLAQREQVRAQGIKTITWTFDPLQSLNAHFNFAKLGVIADAYKINFYGETTSSFLHQVGTDRLWVTWLLDSERVRKRLQTKEKRASFASGMIPALIQVGPDNAPQRNDSSTVRAHQYCSIEIPSDINALQREDPALAGAWREATRWAFTETMARGYIAEEFYRITRKDQSIGTYLLSHGS
jgi:predicted GNAT superfamily acetyltransferase